MHALGRIIRWWLGKLAPGLLVAGLVLGVGAYWLASHDPGDFAAGRRERLQSLGAERDRVQLALGDVRARMDRISNEISAEQDRIQQADKIIAQLKDLESTWDRLVGNREQQQANAHQLVKMVQLRQDATERRAALQTEFKRTTWERDGLDLTRGDIESQLRVIEADSSKAGHYLREAWSRLSRWIIAWLVIYYLVWPVYRFRRWLYSDKN